MNFNDKTVLLLDKNQNLFTDQQVVKLVKILKLDTSVSADQRAQEAEATDKPTPSWQEIFGAE